MSDIKMTEVERFNKALNAAFDILELENYSACSSELFSASNAILTTIESQKEEIEKLTNSNNRRKNDAIDYEQTIFDLRTEGFMKDDQIESLKAITELAVKGLAMELNVAIGTQNKHATSRLDKLLAEIESLQNGTS